MNVSKCGLDLIAEFESLRVDAYTDPVGIATIGYGTIRYPDGRRVRLGDRITEQEAYAFLTFECDDVSRDISALIEPSLNQNQFDALVCFCYNLGVGAFTGSTLLKKLNRGDFAGAAAEFPKWNKGKIDGVKQELKGLTRRRRAERELFEKIGETGIAIPSEESPRQRATRLEGYRDGEKDLIVAWDAKEQVVEIVEFDSKIKDHLIGVLQQYPHASRFQIAPAGKSVPAGERIEFVIRGSVIAPVDNPPTLSGVLARGAEGRDVKFLQQRLVDLGFYDGAIDGDFGRNTDQAVREFQARFFGVAEADGKVGDKTWTKLWGGSLPAAPAAPVVTGSVVPGKCYLLLRKTERRDDVGCHVLDLGYCKDGLLQERLEVCSGAPSRQYFRTAEKSISGSLEPLPEGRWRMGDIEWADGKNNFGGKVWNRGLGPAKIRLEFMGPGSTRRSAIEIHIDWNRRSERGAGTAGCVGIHNIADFKTLVAWCRDGDLRDLYVDWGLGTCPAP